MKKTIFNKNIFKLNKNERPTIIQYKKKSFKYTNYNKKI